MKYIFWFHLVSNSNLKNTLIEELSRIQNNILNPYIEPSVETKIQKPSVAMLRSDKSPQARTPPGTMADFDENSNPNSAGSIGSLKKQQPLAPALAPRESLARESMGSNWFRNYTLDSESTLTNLSSNTSNSTFSFSLHNFLF